MARFLLLIFLIQPGLSDVKTKNCTNADHDVTYIGEVTRTLQFKFDKGVSGEETILKLKLFAAAIPQKKQAAGAIAAASAITRCRRAAEQSIREDRKTEARMLADLAFHFGSHSSLLAQSKAAVKKVSTEAISVGPKHKSITLADSETGLSDEKCTPGEYALETDAIPKAADHSKQQLKFHTIGVEPASDNADAGKPKACVTNGGCSASSGTTNIEIQGGKLYDETLITDPAHGANKADKVDLIIYVSDAQQATQPAKLESEIARAAADTKEYAGDCQSWARLKDMELLKDVAAIASEGKRPATIDTESTAAAKQAVKDLFGSKESECKEKLWAAVEDQEVSTGNSGNQAKAKISTISGLTALDAALTATHMQKLLTATDTSLPKDTTKETKTDKPEEPKKTADECKKSIQQRNPAKIKRVVILMRKNRRVKDAFQKLKLTRKIKSCFL
uniref:Variant surface glycoprotein 1125.4841 n=1 Tax=Trypanosoma brucei TaxID=5691 RepID=A0A1J0RAY4_9TRYP|nr:variant surface glycoprotein 1125.4841 [Trypanosoma brucei]